MKFLDRIEEVRRLKAFLSYEEGGLACLYGRRRVGKSRLLTEMLKGRKDVVYHEADREDAVLQRERLARDVATVLEGFADVVYTDWGRLLDRWQKDAPRASVLVLDEFPYLVGEAKLSLTDAESARELEELKKKALLLPFASNYANVECKLFVADSSTSGVETFWG